MMTLFGYISFFFTSLLPSIFFNLRYLPLVQAVKLPIITYKPKFLSMSGKVVIDCETVSFGMIRLGRHNSHAWPNNGISWSNEGTIVFKGKANVGSDSYLVVKKDSVVEFGDDFLGSASMKLVSCVGIKFGKQGRIGWGTLIMDTNFHPLYDLEKEAFQKPYGKIEIGDCNWFGTGCMIMHSVKTPERCIVGARSVVTRSCNKIFEPYCIHGGSPFRVLKRNIKRIYGQDMVTDYK